MAKKYALRLREKKTFASAGLATVYSDTVPPDQLWCIQLLSVEGNLTTSGGNTRARVYIDGHGYKHYVAEQDGPSADTLYWRAEPFWMIPGERIAVEWDQAQAATTVELLAMGYFVEAEEGVVT